ncbi:hypothetical protein J6590_098745, partial [Homalodisca vitripennis]
WSTNQGQPKSQSSFSSCAERLLVDVLLFLSESVSNSSTSSHNVVYEPGLVDHQLIGDSQFCRFGEQLLGLRRVPTPNSSGRIGICVSGQTISDLHKRVKEKFYPISNKIILMIGTNDFLKDADISTMCGELSALIKTLQETVTSIILLTLPPIPKLEKKYGPSHFKLLEKYNSHIRSLENEDCVRIADICPLYMSSSPRQKCIMHLFERFFSGRTRRPDFIHLNRKGLIMLRRQLTCTGKDNRSRHNLWAPYLPAGRGRRTSGRRDPDKISRISSLLTWENIPIITSI